MRAWLQQKWAVAASFKAALDDPEPAQRALLERYLRRNENTTFGRDHDFSRIRSYEDFRSEVPVRDYTGFEPAIAEIAAGAKGRLTEDPVLGFEETSGSSGNAKLIPFTPGLQREFERSLILWLHALKNRRPACLEGKAYWSLSPPARRRGHTSAGLPVGFESDVAYFPEETGAVLAETMAVTPDLARIENAELFWNETVRQLLACRALSLVSVWSPLFFLRLDEELRNHLKGPFTWNELWPGLSVLSCWTEAQSATWIPAVRERLGDVAIEGKGLLSTEGVVSIPWEGEPVAAVTTHVLECLDDAGEARPLWRLTKGQHYEVVLTTAGGLYRYRTGDVVEITGFMGRTPRLRFCGREGRSCDLAGEKLTESLAVEACRTAGGEVRFLAAGRGGYLAVGCGETGNPGAVEQCLRANPCYRQAVELGQIDPLRAIRLEPGQDAVLAEFFQRKQDCALGDVKIPGLVTAEEWGELQAELRWEFA